MSTETINATSYASPPPRRRCGAYCTPQSRRKNIRTIADVPISQCKHKHMKPRSFSNKLKHTNSNNKKQSICCICLESMTSSDAASLDSCRHLFHRDCIISWSSIENACPLCKTRFMSVTDLANNHKISVQKKEQTAAYHIELGNIIWLDCVCTFCGADDNEHLLLLCDGCDDAAHTYCMGMGDIIPDGDFYCEACNHKYADYINLTGNNNAINDNMQTDNGNNVASIPEINNKNDSDEEYVPSPAPQRRRKRKRKRTRERCVNYASGGDDEYIPNNRRNMNVDRIAKKATRRSQRIRNIEMCNENNSALQENCGERARSASPMDRKRIKATSTLGALIGLPLSQNNNKKGSRTQRMVVIDQNNNKHFLGFKKSNGDKQRFNSLANLFNHNGNNGHGSDGSLSSGSTSNKSILSQRSLCDRGDIDEISTGSEYTPSDFESGLSDNYDMAHLRAVTIKSNRRNGRNCKKKKKCAKVRRSQRLRKQKLAPLADHEDEECEECEDDTVKYKKNNRNYRKRSYKEIDDVQLQHIDIHKNKRMKYNDSSNLRLRRYSSLSQL